jgi:hypothetical protein
MMFYNDILNKLVATQRRRNVQRMESRREREIERNSHLETIAGGILTMTRESWRVMGASIT